MLAHLGTRNSSKKTNMPSLQFHLHLTFCYSFAVASVDFRSSATGAAGAASALALLAHPKKGEKQYKFLLSHEPILLQGDLHGAGKTVKIRVPLVAGLTERQVVAAAGSTFTYPCADGFGSRPYRKEDLKWDLDKGFLTYHGAKHVEKKRKLSATQTEKDSFFNDKVFKPQNQTNAKCHPFDSHLDDW